MGEFPVPDPLVGEYSDAGAEAMASYYFETVAYAWNVGDPRAFTDMVATGCQACANTANDITSVYANGGGAAKARASDFQASAVGRVTDEQAHGAERVRAARVLVAWDGYFWRVVEVEDQPQGES